MQQPAAPHTEAFTLVELTVVLAILGVLTGAILGGQAMIRASQLRGAVSDLSQYRTIANAFADKYNALPGDYANATNNWSTATNGNGNNQLGLDATLGAASEGVQFWYQLQLAGYLKTNFTGVNANTIYSIRPGINVPSLPADKNVGVLPLHHMDVNVWRDNTPGLYEGQLIGNFFALGSNNENTANASFNIYRFRGPAFYVQDASDIDQKIDDGNPFVGGFVADSPDDTGTSIKATSCVYPDATVLVANAPPTGTPSGYRLDLDKTGACRAYYKYTDIM